MATLPAFYINNVTVTSAKTLQLRGNTVTDLRGSADVVGIEVTDLDTLRAKNNKVHRIRSSASTAIGMRFYNIRDALLVYNVVSRTNTGFKFDKITTLSVYNLTSHLCNTQIWTNSTSNFTNIGLSTPDNYSTYKNSLGFNLVNQIIGAPTVTVQYMMYDGIGTLSQTAGGIFTLGDNVSEKQLLYIDEENDDLTPDYISEAVNVGTDNPLRVTTTDIGGLESPVTTETVAKRNYFYSLLDNEFWQLDDPKQPQVAFIRALQSRVLASSSVATTKVGDNTRLKDGTSVEYFSELYPMYASYANSSKFQKRVADMWYAGQNPAVTQSYQNCIGGYNLFPSFFKRMEDYEDGWIIAVSDVAYDNWLNSMWDLRYGIGIDVLGVSTMSRQASAECYANTMNTAADIAPVRWFLHNEVEPPYYLMFTEMYHGFERCTLTNMIYNDDFNICIDEVDIDGSLVTPPIPTDTIITSSVGASGVELSLLDRIWSEDINRYLYYRSSNTTNFTSSWTEITDYIGGVLPLQEAYVQFKIDVENVHRQLDYEFIGLALRRYSSARDWSRPMPVP
jgi:hypothetical protein